MLSWLCAAVVLCGGRGLADAPRAEQEVVSVDTGLPIERLRARLRARPREERVRLEQNLHEFEELPAAARARLLERARALRAQERATDENPPCAPRGHGEGVERARTEETHAWLRECLRERGRAVRARMPPELRRQLEQAPPELRRAILERLAQRREQMSLRALGELHQRLGLTREEVRRLETLPLADRLQALRELGLRWRGERGRGHSRR